MPQSSPTVLALAGAIASLALVGAGPGQVQAQQQQQPQVQQQPAMPSEFSEGQIDTFADAALDVQQIQQDLDMEMQAAADAEERQRLQQDAQQQAQQAIEDKGLSLEEYNTILQAANQDPQLYAMIVEVMGQKSQ